MVSDVLLIHIACYLNFNYKTEGYLKLARAMEPFDLFWVEMDTRDPKALHYIRSRTTIPVASCECHSAAIRGGQSWTWP